MIVSVIKESLNEVVAINLRVMLAERQISKTDLSKRTGISRNALTSLTNGKTKGVRFDTVEQIAKALEIEPYELFK